MALHEAPNLTGGNTLPDEFLESYQISPRISIRLRSGKSFVVFSDDQMSTEPRQMLSPKLWELSVISEIITRKGAEVEVEMK